MWLKNVALGSSSSSNGFIPVRTIAILCGELSIESGALQIQRNNQSNPHFHLFVQFCKLLKLLSIGCLNQRKGLRLKELTILFEDEWLKAIPVSGLR